MDHGSVISHFHKIKSRDLDPRQIFQFYMKPAGGNVSFILTGLNYHLCGRGHCLLGMSSFRPLVRKSSVDRPPSLCWQLHSQMTMQGH